MKKQKPKVSSHHKLPADFSASEINLTPTTNTPLAVPVIDQDAALKIEEVEMMPEELPETEKKGKLLFVIGTIFGLLILAGVIALSVFYFKVPDQKTTTPEATPSPTISITAPTPTVTKADITFEVLNASGIPGQAAKFGKQLEDLGYQVSNIGNANSRETGIKLLLKASLADQKDLLLATLKKDFPQLVYYGEFDSETVNARLIIGQ